ncbi:MAG TPA: hypothetical protein VFT95_00820 [Micromonosporaceae bacterium]|nr:hypothetical protein [Micromonosporaceae bacterium]
MSGASGRVCLIETGATVKEQRTFTVSTADRAMLKALRDRAKS